MTPARTNSVITSRARIAAAVALILGATAAPAVMAADDSDLDALKQQLQILQQKVDTLQHQQQTQAAQAAQQGAPGAAGAATGAPAPAASGPQLHAGPVDVTFGGFLALETAYRSKDESTDIASSFTAIPAGNSQQAYSNEFRETARQSRLSILAQTHDSGSYKLEGYYEMDFLGAAPTANSNQSNSYQPRIRNIYGRFISDDGWYVLAGQSWSLATLEKTGMDPRDENVPGTIDAQYVAGFTWTRNAQLRLVDKIADGYWLGFSLEAPQNVGAINTVPSAAFDGQTLSTGFPGSGQLANNSGASCSVTTALTGVTGATAASTCSVANSNVSDDIAPDVIIKAAADPGYGHYEVFGLGRFFRSTLGTEQQTTAGGGIGAGLILPLAPGLNFQASGLAGKGIGRYGTSTLADTVIKPNGELAPVGEYQALVGFTYSPVEELSTYLYAGREQESKTLYGYGTGEYGLGDYTGANNNGCYDYPMPKTINGAAAGCTFQNRKIDEVTAGLWWKFYQGPLGNAQFGLQLAYIERTAFADAAGNAPDAGMFEGLASFRIYPFQK